MMAKASIVCFLFVALAFGCERSDHDVAIYGPPELTRAVISIDGKEVAVFADPTHHYKWTGWKKAREEFSQPPRHEVIARIENVATGMHELRITKSGYEPIVQRFTYRGKPIELQISDDTLIKTQQEFQSQSASTTSSP
jgi:hypothetical protein